MTTTTAFDLDVGEIRRGLLRHRPRPVLSQAPTLTLACHARRACPQKRSP
jgi:hypothetical protein